MSIDNESIAWRYTTVPGNSQTIIVFDSTRRFDEIQATGAFTAGSPPSPNPLIPGGRRGHWPGWTVTGTVLITGGTAGTTLLLQSKTGNLGATGDWENDDTFPAGVALTAGSSKAIVWKPRGSGFRIRWDAGAAAPTAVMFELAFHPAGYYAGAAA